MKADLSRQTFDPFKRFTRVLTQQGRVQLDADWNEQAAILLHQLRTLAADLIGPQGGPVDNLGFSIGPLTTGGSTLEDAIDFVIGAGHYYVDGILCELDSPYVPIAAFPSGAKQIQVQYWPPGDVGFRIGRYVEISDGSGGVTPALYALITGVDPVLRTLQLDTDVSKFSPTTVRPRVRPIMTYLTQDDYPVTSDDKLKSGDFLVYLDLWERLITFVEDDSIREVALNGPDTAARAKLVWQVKTFAGTAIQPREGQTYCESFKTSDPGAIAGLLGANRGRLTATTPPNSVSTDPCVISPNARYRGPENQLYRVEIHRSGPAWNGVGKPPAEAATFKWSRENGSVIYPIVSFSRSSDGTATVVLENLGRDDRFGLAAGSDGDWVEIVDDDYELQNDRADALGQVQTVDRVALTVTLRAARACTIDPNSVKGLVLRSWDQKAGEASDGGLTLSEGAALVIESDKDQWLELEDGVKIQFQEPDVGQPQNLYRRGDYWLIPARTATGAVEWPTALDSKGVAHPVAKAPEGIGHHYAALGVIKVNNGVVSLQGDCRKKFGALAK